MLIWSRSYNPEAWEILTQPWGGLRHPAEHDRDEPLSLGDMNFREAFLSGLLTTVIGVIIALPFGLHIPQRHLVATAATAKINDRERGRTSGVISAGRRWREHASAGRWTRRRGADWS